MQNNDRAKLSELLEFIKKNYKNNVWDNGISKLCEMYPQVTDCQCREVFISKQYNNSLPEIHITLNYIDSEFFYWETIAIKYLVIGKNNDQIDIIATTRIPKSDEEKIMKEIDFSKLYNYYMENDFPCKCYGLNALYNLGGKVENVHIQIEYGKQIVIGNSNSYNIVYDIVLDENSQDVMVDRTDNVGLEKIKPTYAHDLNLLDNLTVSFNDLPLYIQDALNSDSYQDGYQKKKSIYKIKR